MASIADSRYLSICYSPRATIRAIVSEDPRQRVTLLVLIRYLLTGLAYLFGINRAASAMKASTAAARKAALQFDRVSGPLMLVVSPILGLALLYLDGVLIRWLGAKMGGKAGAAEIRAAVAWSLVPVIAGTIVNLVLLAFGIFWLPPVYSAHPSIFRAEFSPRRIVGWAWFAWSLILECQCISELHGISALRALAAWAVAKLTELVLFIVASVVTISLVITALHLTRIVGGVPVLAFSAALVLLIYLLIRQLTA
jgi:hypothetical protein